MIWKGITAKLWFALILLVLLSFVVTGFAGDRFIRNLYYRQRTEELLTQGEILARSLSDPARRSRLLDEVDLLGGFARAGVMIIDSQGKIQSCAMRGGGFFGHGMHRGWPAPGMHLDASEAERVLDGNIVVSRGYHPGFDTAMLTVAVPIKSGQEVLGGVLLYKPLASLDEAAANMRRTILWAALAGVLLATVISLFFSRSFTRPLVVMAGAARSMAAGDFSTRVPVYGNDEIGNLAASFNYLAGRLEDTIRALSQEKLKLDRVVNGMTDGVIAYDGEGKILFSNPQAERLLGMPLKPGAKLDPGLLKVTNQVASEGEGGEGEIACGRLFLAVRAAPLQESSGGTAGAVAVFQDITARRRLEQLRQEFLASISHELRTPLSFIQGYTEALVDGLAQNEGERQEYLQIILEETVRLRRLVDDLLDLSKAAAGQLQLIKEWFDPVELAWRVARKFQPAMEGKGLKLEVKVEGEVPSLYGDPARLEQALANLLANAQQYTPGGGQVVVRVRREGKEVAFSVADTGVGIPPEELPYIWERFYRVDRSRSRRDGGSGLGLAMVKALVEAHGGRAEATSQVGKGSTFTLYLPAANGFGPQGQPGGVNIDSESKA
ncbi:MAG: two-component system, OmpR family, sensor histidine kinase ResE [Clostridia bacterium]|nr:two-component system, OmpR family, sensor histidine kinase ResE [Clostridia bacterium]